MIHCLIVKSFFRTYIALYSCRGRDQKRSCHLERRDSWVCTLGFCICAHVLTYKFRRPRDDYIATISKPSSWGGAIELTVLAKYYSTEIASIDVETGRIDHFTPPPENDSGNRCVLIYSGIHYDAATVSPMLDAPADFHQTIMPVVSQGDDDPILTAAKKLADKLRAKKAYTNTATFDLKCQVRLYASVRSLLSEIHFITPQVCGKGLKGEKEARAHASETGHAKFGEY